jgi:translation initiation factor 2B subunit (eIF-2B alpha/beta/delta family)
MAPIVTLAARVFESFDDNDNDDDIDEARRRVARVAEEFRENIAVASARCGAQFAALLERGDRVLTLSDSSTVRAGLLKAADGRGLEVVCLESRPLNEGLRLARALADGGVHVTVCVDAAAAALLPGCRAVVMGADSVGDSGIVNKVGSVAVALSARAAGVPVWVVTDRTKFLPEGFPQPIDDDRPADEVAKATGGVRVWNRYFEMLPFDWVRWVVTDAGPIDPLGLAEERRDLPLPAELARWAARRGGHGVEETS